jgi:glycosyltransferase involved in cell wall biosynthesis
MTGAANPSVTVVIPCFNYGAFVRDAVRSAAGQLGARVRIVVVNDGSTDGRSPGDCDDCRRLGASVIHQPNLGLPAARNRGAAEADTEFLLFLDADDTLEPGGVRDLAAAVRAEDRAGRGGDISHAYGRQRVLEAGRTSIWRVPDWDPELMMITNLHAVTALVRRERFEAVGGFDPAMREGYEDWDLWLKFVERGWRGVRIPGTVFVWRRHGTRTMISGAVAHHDLLYRRMIQSHRVLFERHADAILARMNGMLREHDMNWLDESGLPIHLRGLLRQREMFERLPAVRLHHAVHRVIDALPGPARAAAREGLQAAGWVLRGFRPRARRALPGSGAPDANRARTAAITAPGTRR